MDNKENFIKNWKDELRSQVQPIVKAGKRKPTIAIVCVDQKVNEDFVKTCKEVGYIGEIYEIPKEELAQENVLWRMLGNLDTDVAYVQEPLPEGFENPLPMDRYTKRGILTFVKSLNIQGPIERAIVSAAADGYEVRIGDIVLREEDVRQLEQLALLEEGLQAWKEYD